ncbi:protein LTO1 homolog isoform X1 [Topomyia yanbarensis]|uniref:protein LTO1 homolog isoform X1 n=1 Tax=Topomyia yanbarensis TaxID=2498891 RepID=UPI00273B8243|nr:protein LTO1 homolog isoform X1 [Topomyia yanbarensis]
MVVLFLLDAQTIKTKLFHVLIAVMSEAESKSKPLQQETEVDINDVFEDLLLVEERLTERSYQEGLQVGSQEGNVEAYHFGYHRGAEIGAELGFYYGVLCARESSAEGSSSKATALLQELKKEIEAFPKVNDLEIDILEKLLKLRNKYKKLCTLLKISAKYSRTNELSF